jgi:hypothetical protein
VGIQVRARSYAAPTYDCSNYGEGERGYIVHSCLQNSFLFNLSLVLSGVAIYP